MTEANDSCEYGFQSTLSLRRATIDRFATHDRTNGFQSTLSLRRATEEDNND